MKRGEDRHAVLSFFLSPGSCDLRLGASDEVIIDDYMRSKDNLMDMLTDHVRAHPEVDLEIIVPHRENIERLLAQR